MNNEDRKIKYEHCIPCSYYFSLYDRRKITEIDLFIALQSHYFLSVDMITIKNIMNFNPITNIDFIRCIHNTVAVAAREAIRAWQLETSKRIDMEDLLRIEEWHFIQYQILHGLTTELDFNILYPILGVDFGDGLSLMHNKTFAHTWGEARKAGEEFQKIANMIYPWYDVVDYQVAAREATKAEWSLLP